MNDFSMLEDIVDEVLPYFIDDFHQKIEQLEQLVEKFVMLFDRGEEYYAILRIIHSLKGTASSFRFPTVAIIAHRLEDYLAKISKFSRQNADDIYRHTKAMTQIVDSGRDPGEAGHAIVRMLPVASSLYLEESQRSPIETLFIGPKNFQFAILESELRSCGCGVVGVDNSFQAIEMAARTRPDLILVSNVVDILSGIEIARILRTIALTRNIPLIFVMSEIEDPAERARLLASLPSGIEVVRKGQNLPRDLAQALFRVKMV